MYTINEQSRSTVKVFFCPKTTIVFFQRAYHSILNRIDDLFILWNSYAPKNLSTSQSGSVRLRVWLKLKRYHFAEKVSMKTTGWSSHELRYKKIGYHVNHIFQTDTQHNSICKKTQSCKNIIVYHNIYYFSICFKCQPMHVIYLSIIFCIFQVFDKFDTVLTTKKLILNSKYSSCFLNSSCVRSNFNPPYFDRNQSPLWYSVCCFVSHHVTTHVYEKAYFVLKMTKIKHMCAITQTTDTLRTFNNLNG